MLLTMAAHLRGLQGQFLEWDDPTHITQNAFIRALTLRNVHAMFAEPVAKLYCPLTWLSFAVDYQIWGRDAFGYHFTNLLLHLANTALVLLLVYRLLRERTQHAIPVALLTAALFGVHPLRVESVAWATERKDVLFAFFYLLSLLAYIRWAERHERTGYWLCFGLFVLSAHSKSTAVTLPVVLLLLDAFVFRRLAWLEKLPYFGVSIIVGLATVVAQASGKGETVAGTEIIPIWARLGLLGYCPLFYVRKFFWPTHLSAVYPTFDEMNWTPFIALGWLLAFIGVTVGIVLLRRRMPALLPSWLFYLATLSPTIGLLPVGIHVTADRYSYLSLLGLALPVSLGIAVLARRTKYVWLVAAGIVLVLAAAAFQRTAVWHDTETLFTSVLRENPDCLPAHLNIIDWYIQHKQFDEAIAHGRKAVELAPNGPLGRKMLAYALMNTGQHSEAIRVLRPAIDHGTKEPDIWRALGECFIAERDWTNAQAALKTALRYGGPDERIMALLDEVKAKRTQD